ncbi:MULTISPECIES: PA2169 family four-helix-bundle protein [unclassified Pseudomonas]|uniref:ferritin-like domain-containing protein n=1 Tax=unclassified Pseudomonas TaxID=196821 RepID=UPI00244A4082|nr:MULTISPECIES: PA2169 family four-helix-bundle protein [unclassified Pseudomonas]MDG9925209.1 PA2169 family four-helix-bundle protein [Pseudomonas sp. GD04045]MDH0035339.1 PA2169 family four-helix-bundle protein [Pseudomonas sp. GD04019]
MTSQANVLNQLIEITRDGEHFYRHAEAAVEDQRLKAVFHDMAQAKVGIIQALALKVAENHDYPAESGTLSGSLHRLYAQTRARMASDGEATYVAELESAEDRLLHAFEEALEEADDDLRTVLAPEVPKLRASHERMSELKRTLN